MIDPVMELNQRAKQIKEYKNRIQTLTENVQRMQQSSHSSDINSMNEFASSDLGALQTSLSTAQRTISRLDNVYQNNRSICEGSIFPER